MAPASAAERQHKPRERLKATGTYNHYKLRNVNYSRAYRIKKAKEFENLKTEDKEKLLKQNRAKANKRQSECRKRKQNQVTVVSPNKSGYSSNQGLNHAAYRIKKMLPHSSPSKKQQVVKKLSKEFNILPNEVNYWKTTLDKAASELVKMIEIFYQRDDISRMCPGRRDVVTVKTSNGKVKLQKRHLYFKIRETHAIFLSEYPEVKISLSKFAMLRPPQVVLSSQTPTNVCTCVYHQNTILALDPRHTYMPNIPISNKDFPSSCLASPDSKNCWYNECEHTNCGFEYFYPFPNDDSNK